MADDSRARHRARPAFSTSIRSSVRDNCDLDSSPENRRQKEFNNRTLRSGGEEIDDLLNSLIGAVVGGFELAGRLVMRVGAVVEAAVGEWAAESFVEEQEEQRNLNPLGGETVGVAGAVALQQTVAFELAQVVAKLVEAVGAVGEVESGENGVVDLLGGPAADMAAAMEEDFEQADDAGVVDLDPGVAHRADGDGQGEALQQRKVDVDIEPPQEEEGFEPPVPLTILRPS